MKPAARRRGGAVTTTRVAVAGATGYTGQELLRLLSRHPAVTITAAMSSGATRRQASAGARPPVERHDHAARTSAPDALRDADVVFLALPDKAAAELAPALVDAGVRVIDLSGAFRLRSEAARARWYPETHRVPGRHSPTASPSCSATPSRARGWWPTRAATRRPRCWRSRRLRPRACSCRRRRHRRRQVGRVRRRQDAVRAHALLRSARQPRRLRRVRPSARRRNRAGRRRALGAEPPDTP